MKYNFFIDIDGTIINFLKRYCEFHYKYTGENLNWKDLKEYDLSVYFKTKLKYEYLHYFEFYKKDEIEFIENSVESINQIYEYGHSIKFLTSCVTRQSMIGKFDLLSETFHWFDIEKHWVILSSKDLIRCDSGVFIDDCAHHIISSKIPLKFCIQQPHNEQYLDTGIFSYSDWKSISDQFCA